MRVTALLVGVFLTLHTPTYGQPPEVQQAIASALGWYYRWMETLPPELASINCSVKLFEERSYALCEPVQLSMNIETRATRPPHVSYLGREPSPFDEALKAFRRNVNRNGDSLGPVRKFSIAVPDISSCTIDLKQTAHAESAVLTKEVRSALLQSGHTMRYPVVCQGDPFYLVYCLKDREILWIWLYEIEGERAGLRWSYETGAHQRKPPSRMIENLGRKELWYKVESRVE